MYEVFVPNKKRHCKERKDIKIVFVKNQNTIKIIQYHFKKLYIILSRIYFDFEKSK